MDYVNKVRTSGENRVRVDSDMKIPATTSILLLRDLIYQVYRLNNRIMSLNLTDEQYAALAGLTNFTDAVTDVEYPDFVKRVFYAKELPTVLIPSNYMQTETE